MGNKQSFDFLGTALIVTGLTALLLGLTTGQEGDWGRPHVIVELAVAATTLALVPLWEARTSQPLIDLTLFKNRLFSFGNIAGFLSFLGMSANVFLMPFFLQLSLDYSPLHAGLLMTPTALAITVVAPLSGWLSDRLGARILSSLGLAINTATLVWISTLTQQATYKDVLVRLVVLGVGLGLFQSPNNSSVMGSVPRHSLGIAGGFLSMMRNIGQVVGMALAGTILASTMVTILGHASFEALHAGGDPGERATILGAFMVGMHRAYLVAAMISFLGLWTSLVRGKPEADAQHIKVPQSQIG